MTNKKICIKCNELKNYDEYYLDKRMSGGHKNTCKDCIRLMFKENRDIWVRSTITTKTCSKCEEIKDISEFWEDSHKKSGFRCKCKDCTKKRRVDNKENIAKIKHKCYMKYQDQNIEYSINYRILNIVDVIQREKKYYKKRRRIDPTYKLKTAIRSNISYAIKRCGYIKKSSTCKILGCTWDEFKVWIEYDFFIQGMTWDSYGMYGWHLDHIIPVSLGADEEEVIALNHYTNFQPLWWYDNFEKGDKIPDEFKNIT